MGKVDPEVREHSRHVTFDDLTEEQQEAVMQVIGPLGLAPDECKFGVGTVAYKFAMENKGQMTLFGGEE